MIVAALHGGAGANPARDYALECAHMRAVLESSRQELLGGASAIDVAVAAVYRMEQSGHYIAGRGASPNGDGRVELDACAMDGSRGLAGAVAALQGFQSAIAVAHAVLNRSAHVRLVGEGAASFARLHGMAEIPSNDWYASACADEANALRSARSGTVGCVVLDRLGRLASASLPLGFLASCRGV